MQNIGKLFYKDYYNNIDFKYILEDNSETRDIPKETNNKILEAALVPIDKITSANTFIELKIIYPGLITGIGLTHDTPKLKEGFSLGMHFDYTFGMPVIYGSTIKGILHHYFDSFFKEKYPYKKSIANDFLFDIFNEEVHNDSKKEKNHINKSIYERDIFFDAVLIKADSKNRILVIDSITPHGDNPLRNPIPITFLKIAPGCTIEFRFKLVDSVIIKDKQKYEFTKKEKEALFKDIICTVGVGAKTNVGYGQFE